MNKSNSGIAIVLVLMMLLFILPVLFWLITSLNVQNTELMKKEWIVQATTILDNAIEKYTKVFEEDYYTSHYINSGIFGLQKHYDCSFIYKNVSYKSYNGEIIFPKRLKHIFNIIIGATIRNSSDRNLIGITPSYSGMPISGIYLHTTHQFSSPIYEYGLLVDGDCKVSRQIVFSSGNYMVSGNLDIKDDNVEFIGNLIVGGDLKLEEKDLKVKQGNIFCGKTKTGPKSYILDTGYNLYSNFVPAESTMYINIKPDFYEYANNYYLDTSAFSYEISFFGGKNNFGYEFSSFTVTYLGGPKDGLSDTFDIPLGGPGWYANKTISTGTIILADRDVLIYGKVRGLVTLFCKGNITIGEKDNLTKYGHETSSDCFAAIAEGDIILKSNDNPGITSLVVHGILFGCGTNSEIKAQAQHDNDPTLFIKGSVNKMIKDGPGHKFKRVEVSYDTAISSYTPPGIPERPILVNRYYTNKYIMNP